MAFTRERPGWQWWCLLPVRNGHRDARTRAGDKPTYLLYGRQNLGHVPDIEKRLRALFDDMNLRVSLTCVDRA